MKLSHRFKKQQGKKAAIFVECLANMSVEGPESSLLDYTKEWMARINRGGLFDISDEGYSLFVAIELALRDKLTQHLHHSAVSGQRDLQASKGSIIDTVSADPEVEFRWTFVSLDIEDEVVGTQLLKYIVELWLTIRGYTISSSWMEKYKQVKKTSTKWSKGLRKTLQGDPQIEKWRFCVFIILSYNVFSLIKQCHQLDTLPMVSSCCCHGQDLGQQILAPGGRQYCPRTPCGGLVTTSTSGSLVPKERLKWVLAKSLTEQTSNSRLRKEISSSLNKWFHWIIEGRVG